MLILSRGILLLSVWCLAAAALWAAGGAWLQHRQVSAEVESLESSYNEQMNDYAGLLSEGDRLQSDQSAKIRLLKDRFGYTEPDEIPIVILDESDSAAN